MAYKLLLKDFKTFEKTKFFLEELPSEEDLFSDLKSLEVIKDIPNFSNSNWYNKLISGVIISDQVNLNSAIILTDIENIPKSISNEFYVYKVPIKMFIDADYSAHINEIFVSDNKNLIFFSSDENVIVNMEDVRILHTGSTDNTEEYELCYLLAGNIVQDGMKNLDVSILHTVENF